MRNEPTLFVLVNAPNGLFRKKVDKVFTHFEYLAVCDPSKRDFQDPDKSYPNAENVKPLGEWDRNKFAPVITAPDKQYFANNMSARPALAERMFEIAKRCRYEGTAVIVPMPGSQHTEIDPTAKIPLSKTYYADIQLDRDDRMPRIIVGDRFDFEPGVLPVVQAPVRDEVAFYGQVVQSESLNTMDSIKVVTHRVSKQNTEGSIKSMSTAEIFQRTVDDVREATASDPRIFFKRAHRTPITIFGNADELTHKRLKRGLSLLMSTLKQLGYDEGVPQNYQKILLFGQGTEYETNGMAPVPIFAHLLHKFRDIAAGALYAFCSDDQISSFATPAITTGSPLSRYIFDGPGGTGKLECCIFV